MSARWRYIIQESGKGLRRNPLMTVAVILSITVSLTLLGATLLLRDQIDLATDDWVDQVEVSIFLCDGTTCPEITEQQQETLRRDLEDQPVVEEVHYESKEEAYERFTELFRDQQNLLEIVEPDILPASFRVSLVDPDEFLVIAQQFEAYPGVEDIVDQREILTQFLNFTRIVRNGALAVAVIQLAAAALLIGNTILMSAFARREQTSIMKLVGASNWYIRLPFLMEAVITGLLGALVSWGLLYGVVPRVTEGLSREVLLMPFIGIDHVIAAGPPLLLAGFGIAAVSSIVALWFFQDS
jgi:cell division transport system permease protein